MDPLIEDITKFADSVVRSYEKDLKPVLIDSICRNLGVTVKKNEEEEKSQENNTQDNEQEKNEEDNTQDNTQDRYQRIEEKLDILIEAVKTLNQNLVSRNFS